MIDTDRNADRRRAGLLTSVGDRWRGAAAAGSRPSRLAAFVAFLYFLPLLGIPGPDPLAAYRLDRRRQRLAAACCSTCAIYVLLALGLNVVVGFAGLLDLGYFGFFAVGAYTVALFGSTSPEASGSSRSSTCRTWAVAGRSACRSRSRWR